MDNEPAEFEAEWRSIIVKYNLESNEWFNYMFSIRKKWISAYFRDLFLGGIMRTTSRSESENGFFYNFTNPHVTLVELFMRFESAMDSQKHRQEKLNYDSKHSLPQIKTPLPLERHASKVYTHTIFYMFQRELTISCFYCGIIGTTKEHDTESVVVKDFARSKNYIVLFNAQNDVITGSCKFFERLCILCRHSLCVLNSRYIKELPRSYVLGRWTKDAQQKPIFGMDDNLLEECRQVNSKKKLLCEIWSEIYNCVALSERNEEDLVNLAGILKGFSKTVLERNSSGTQLTKVQEMEIFVGPSATSYLNILNPKQSSNKGTGSNTACDGVTTLANPQFRPFGCSCWL
ncbi:protein FAR1-RELATED SEQUENCE 9-like [Spinacia oleracea]|uniref:Protein FAR1-RELATED SEQUENCE 9-like n=1 Tax=Spinacia oleracea TaxID=3562 RepID=A0A9R0J637_SPIOL|nr:protein FAR1-RELATED SEQUENCE 9-like [Spinacia oleracea]